MTHLDRFLSVMEYQSVDRVPNWEAGVWPQTIERWEREGMERSRYHFNWFPGEEAMGMDPREFIQFNGGMIPTFEHQTIEEDDQTITFRDGQGRVRKALKAGTVHGGRMSMDTYISFAVNSMEDWRQVKKRWNPHDARRREPHWRALRPAGWRARTHPLIFGPNCSTMGFYWFARELMGTENLSYAWYDQPELMHDMMAFVADFLIESMRPVLQTTSVDYIMLAEDLSMRSGPLLSPESYRTFIYPHLKRLIEFAKSNGVRYVGIDTDGNPEALFRMFLDAGVDLIWPCERAADQDPIRLRKTYGKSLRLWGGVDKRELAKDPAAIDAHLRTFLPLIEEGGFIPTIDHTASPDISWANIQHYIESKPRLLEGKL